MVDRILCVDDDELFGYGLKACLKSRYEVSVASSLTLARQSLQTHTVDLVLLDIKLDGENGLDLIPEIQKIDPSIGIIMLSGLGEPEFIFRAIKQGAADVLEKPYVVDELIAVIEKNLTQKRIQERHLAQMAYLKHLDVDPLLGFCDSMMHIHQQICDLKGYRGPVLIEGGNGSGKTLVCETIHKQEKEARRPFIPLDLQEVSPSRLAAELLGQNRDQDGARKWGCLSLANGGDLFLKNVDQLSLDLQDALVHFIETEEWTPLGESKFWSAPVRILAATTKNLSQLVQDGVFLEKLYLKLCARHLRLPSLHERGDDIEVIACHYLEKASKGRKVFSPEVFSLLKNYHWPGHVAELESLIDSLVLLNHHKEIGLADFPKWIREADSCHPEKEKLSLSEALALRSSKAVNL